MPTLHFARALTPGGWRSGVRVAMSDGRIAAVACDAAPAPGDDRYGIGLPAPGNLHSHTFQRAMAGLAEIRGPGADTFWTWRETMYRCALAMTPDDVEAVAAQAFVEMLESGFGAVAEFHYLHNAPDGRPYADPAELALRIAKAAAENGIGLTLLPVFYAHADFGAAPLRPEQRRFGFDLDGYACLVARLRAALPATVVGVAPHSLRAVAPDELSPVVALAEGSPIHIHVAEQVREVEACLAATGARPVRWLLDQAEVDETWCLIHATHMDADETSALARSGATAGLCPVTEANLGDGAFPARAYLDPGGRFGVGTDSNVAISLAAELRGLEYAQRLTTRTRNVLAPVGGSTGRALFDAAATGGARALGRASGRIEPGAAADLLALDANHPSLAGRADDAWLDVWIFGGREVVDAVWSDGLRQVSGGRHVRRDAVAARFAATLRRLA